MTVTKAIIPVAGWGTRRLPITKTIEKCMLPIGNRPLVDYVVQDCLKAGINDIYFIVGEQSTQLKDYYRSNISLNDYLRRNGKTDKLGMVGSLGGGTLHYIVQPSYGKYGTAVPIALAAPYVKQGESVVVLMGDDFFYNKDGSSEVQRLIDGTPEGQSGILTAVLEDDETATARYGSIESDAEGNVVRITEHPEISPSPFYKNVSKYLLTSHMINAVADYAARDDVVGEYGIFDPFEAELMKGQTMKVIAAKGQYLDGGSVEGWLHANNVVAGEA